MTEPYTDINRLSGVVVVGWWLFTNLTASSLYSCPVNLTWPAVSVTCRPCRGSPAWTAGSRPSPPGQ